MPLTAMFNNERILAHRTQDHEWVALKRAYKSGELVLSCGQPAVPVTRQGTKFFAHHPNADKTGHEGHEETADHLDAKALIAEAAEGLGWTTTIEYAGPNREWIADVLVERDGERIALEVQWSAQSSADFARRQARYANAGIKCFWFVAEKNRSAAREANVPFAAFYHDNIYYVTMTELFPGDKVFYPMTEEAVEHVLAIGYRRKFQASVDSLTFAYSWRKCEGCTRLSALFYLSEFTVTSKCGRPGKYYRRVTDSFGHIHLGSNPIEQDVQDILDGALAGEGTAARFDTPQGGRLAFCCRSCGQQIKDADYVLASGYFEITVEVSSAPFELHPTMLQSRHICNDVGRGRCSQNSTGGLRAVNGSMFVRGAFMDGDNIFSGR